MKTTELNERLAKAMGWEAYPEELHFHPPKRQPIRWDDEANLPATDHTAYHTHVTPYLDSLGLMEKWAERVCKNLNLDGESLVELYFDYDALKECCFDTDGLVALLTRGVGIDALAAAEVIEEYNRSQE